MTGRHRSAYPRLLVRPAVVRENAAAVTDRFDGRVVGVTKAVRGHPAVAEAMRSAGVAGLADSRTANLERLRDATDAETTMLVVPMHTEVERVVAAADRSLQSELAVVEATAAAARDRGTVHEVLLMVDVGDRREGLLPDDVVPAAERVAALEGVELVGLGTNVGCFGGVIPDAGSMGSFVDLVERVEARLGRRLPVVSGGSSVTLPLAEAGDLPGRVDELRVGEAILLGTDLTRDRVIPYCRRDGFELRAEVVECKRKPSTPEGRLGNNTGGRPAEFEDRGIRERAILAVGSQDVEPAGLEPLDPGVEVLGASSDHTVLDVTGTDRDVSVGDVLGFHLRYAALVRACTSPYVDTEVIREGGDSPDCDRAEGDGTPGDRAEGDGTPGDRTEGDDGRESPPRGDP